MALNEPEINESASHNLLSHQFSNSLGVAFHDSHSIYTTFCFKSSPAANFTQPPIPTGCNLQVAATAARSSP